MKLNELLKKVTTYIKNVWNKLFNKKNDIIVTVDTKPTTNIVEPSNPPKPKTNIVEPSDPPKPKTDTIIAKVEPSDPPKPTKP